MGVGGRGAVCCQQVGPWGTAAACVSDDGFRCCRCHAPWPSAESPLAGWLAGWLLAAPLLQCVDKTPAEVQRSSAEAVVQLLKSLQ